MVKERERERCIFLFCFPMLNPYSPALWPSHCRTRGGLLILPPSPSRVLPLPALWLSHCVEKGGQPRDPSPQTENFLIIFLSLSPFNNIAAHIFSTTVDLYNFQFLISNNSINMTSSKIKSMVLRFSTNELTLMLRPK